MSTQLAKQIEMRMKARNLSVAALEREAGLTTHSVKNILRGKSKRPSAEVVQAVADVLGCTVKELLENTELFQAEEAFVPKAEMAEAPFDHPELLSQVVEVVLEGIAQRKASLTIKKALMCIEETYLHSLQKDASKVDQDFADWFLDLNIN